MKKLVKDAEAVAPTEGSTRSNRRRFVVLYAGLVLCGPVAPLVDPHLFMGFDRDYYFMFLVLISTVGPALFVAPMIAGITGHYKQKKVMMDQREYSRLPETSFTMVRGERSTKRSRKAEVPQSQLRKESVMRQAKGRRGCF